MIPFLTYPWALFAAITLPILAIIYLFHNRFKRHYVSGLFLWEHAMRAREGGTVIKRMQIPWLFILELLILIALILAATDPRLPYKTSKYSVVVILDDSASMLAGNNSGSTRDIAITEIRKIVQHGQFKSVSFVLARQNPVLLDIVHDSQWQDSELAKQWSCQSVFSDLHAAVALATELTDGKSQILVITDHAPVIEPEDGQVEWHAFGKRQDNIGFVNVRRSYNNGKDRLFVAVGNYSGNDVKLTVPIVSADRIIDTIILKLPAGGEKSAIMTLPSACGTISMRLPDDSMPVDNIVTLLPEKPQKIGIEITINNEKLRKYIEAAVSATGLWDKLAPVNFLITDQNILPEGNSVWELRLKHPAKAVAYRGPFVVDYNHPLTQGLNFDGVVWGASSSNELPGQPLILAGNIPLLSETVSISDKHIFNMQITPDISNLQLTPAWPALIWNMLKLRSDVLLGTVSRNVPVNFLAPAESDLRTCESGIWGDWHSRENLIESYRSWAWVAALIALLLLTIHTVLIARNIPVKEVSS